MSDEFFRTRLGAKFYESDVPRIATALETIARAMTADVAPVYKFRCSAKDCEEPVTGLCATHARELQHAWVIHDEDGDDFHVIASIEGVLAFFNRQADADEEKHGTSIGADASRFKLTQWRNKNTATPLTLYGWRCVRVTVAP